MGFARNSIRLKQSNPVLRIHHANTSVRSNDARKRSELNHRLALEITGCLRALNVPDAVAAKVQNIRDAQAAGFAVDVFCVLEACSENELDGARNGAVSSFVRQMSIALEGVGEVANCSWWPHTAGVLNQNGKLLSQYRPAFPGYPYRHHPFMNVDNTIAQAHKLNLVGEIRRQFSMRMGRNYDLVWRQRPDWVTTGLIMGQLRDSLLHPHRMGIEPHSAHALRGDFAVPQVCISHAITDIEAILTIEAADHYSALYREFSSLYNRSHSHFGGPELLMDLHMRTIGNRPNGFRYMMPDGWHLYRCSEGCFGKSTPCRRMVPATDSGMDACSEAAKSHPALSVLRPIDTKSPYGNTLDDAITRISRLQGLLDAGALSQSEFLAKKAELLARTTW